MRVCPAALPQAWRTPQHPTFRRTRGRAATGLFFRGVCDLRGFFTKAGGGASFTGAVGAAGFASPHVPIDGNTAETDPSADTKWSGLAALHRSGGNTRNLGFYF